jgi:hypothetical protein
MVRRLLCLTMLLAASAAAAACDEKLSSIAGPTPNLEPTFASIQKEIFETTDSAGRVACTGCHTSTGRNPSGGMNLNHDVAYDSLVNVPARGKPGAIRVIPGDPANSYIVHKVEGSPDIAGRRMPFSGEPFLAAGQVLILKRWIEIGAPRN